MSSALRRSQIIFVFLFLAVIFLPSIDSIFHIDPVAQQSENRRVGEWPELPKGFKGIANFTKLFGDFFSDNFGFRNSLIRVYGVLKIKFLGISSSSQVVLGKQGWLYLDSMGNIATYRNLYPFTQAELEDFAVKLKQRKDWCERRGIQFIFTITPDAHSLYSEYLPDWMTKANPGSRMDQLLEYLKKNTNLEVIDLRPALRDGKKLGKVYYRTDSHWNSLGAYIGFREIMRSIRKWYPKVSEPRSLKEYDIKTVPFVSGDLTRLLGMQQVWEDSSEELIPRFKPAPYERSDEDKGKNGFHFTTYNKDVAHFPVVALIDSFAGGLAPYLSSTFSQVRYMWGYEFDPQEILTYRPRVLIQSMVERSLSWGGLSHSIEVQEDRGYGF